MPAHPSIEVAVSAIEQEIVRSLHALPRGSDAARTLALAAEGLRLLRCALADQSADYDRELRRLRELQHGGEEPLVETDVAGIVWRANDAAGELLQAAPRNMMRAPLATFLPEGEHDAYYQVLAHLRSSVRDAPPHGRPVTVGWRVRPGR